jgi:hypothetical protein
MLKSSNNSIVVRLAACAANITLVCSFAAQNCKIKKSAGFFD